METDETAKRAESMTVESGIAKITALEAELLQWGRTRMDVNNQILMRAYESCQELVMRNLKSESRLATMT
jgi:hypothetical protein